MTTKRWIAVTGCLALVAGLGSAGCKEKREEVREEPVDEPGQVASSPVAAGEQAAKSQVRALKVPTGAAPRRTRMRRGRPMDPGPVHNTEGYDKLADNTFKSPLKEPLSTFSIDVDTASYSNVRRFINNSQMPPPDAVRIEEMINYFSYDYPAPRGDDPFSVVTEVSRCPWDDSHRLALIGLQGRRIDTSKLPSFNLVFLLDVSGSMSSANKLPLLKSALRMLVNEMRPRDRVAIVVYAGAAGLVLPPTPGNKRERILEALDNLRAGGSTAGGAGIKLAYKVARQSFARDGNNRVILATDGDFNVGQSSDGELVRLMEEQRKHGVALTVLGFGTGNVKDSRMEKLADKGNGNYAYIDSILEAKKVLVTQMGGTLLTIAKDVKLQVEFNPTKVKGYRLIGYVNRKLAAQDFDDDKKDAGELGAGHAVTAMYEIIPAGSREKVPGVAGLKYQTTKVKQGAKDSPELMNVKLRYKPPRGDRSKLITGPVIDRDTSISKTTNAFRFAAAVAQFGMLLRDSKYKGEASYDGLLRLARGAMGDDTHGYRAEFVQLVKKAALLSGGSNASGGE